MSARAAESVAERARQLCHELYEPSTPQDLYHVVGDLVDAQRSLEQACRMIARQLDAADPDSYYDDRDHHAAFITLEVVR